MSATETVRLLGRDVPVLAADDGTMHAEDDGKPASTKRVAPTSHGRPGINRARIGMPWRPAIGARRGSVGFWAISNVEPDQDQWLTCPPDGGVGRSSGAYRP